jgi:YidC/Oxa1 family membrane protein insertase
MEKRFTLFLILTIGVLVLWQQLVVGPSRPEKPPEVPKTGERPVPDTPTQPDPEVRPEDPVRPPVPAVPPESVQRTIIENSRLRFHLSNVGGTVERAELLDYHPTAFKRDLAVPLALMQQFSPRVSALALTDLDAARSDLEVTAWESDRAADGRSIAYHSELALAGDLGPMRIRKELRLPHEDARYAELRLGFSLPGVSGAVGSRVTRKFRLQITGGVFLEPGGSVMTPPRSAVGLVDRGEEELEVVTAAEVHKAGKPERLALRGIHRYVADLSNYFGAFLVLTEFPPGGAANVAFIDIDQVRAGDPGVGEIVGRTASSVEFTVEVPVGGATEIGAILYLGPIDSEIVTEALAGVSWGAAEGEGPITPDVARVYQEQLGWASFIGRAVLWCLDKLHGVTGNWGWAIVLLTLVVRLLLFPVNRRSQGAMIRHGEAMAKLRPKIEALKEKYKNEPQKLGQEQMKLFKQEGVPMVPLGGCLPLLLQIPIFFGLFSALRSSVALRGAPWLWVQDLSQPDHLIRFQEAIANPLSFCSFCCPVPQPPITGLHLLPILMTFAWVGSSMLMPRPATGDPQMEQQRKLMMFMPVLMGLFMYSYGAALSLYWLTSSLWGMFESQVIKRLFPLKGTAAANARAAARGS